MKKLIAVVLAVMLLASVSGVALAADFDNYKNVGHGALNGPHYNLNIIGMCHEKDSPMTGTSGHTIFVPLKGRAKINLYPSTSGYGGEVTPYGGCTKDFLVMDRNAFDGPAEFCLPVPEILGPCPDDATWDEVSYTVYARALGRPGGQSFTTTCAETIEDNGEIYCSSIVMNLKRLSGKQSFMDVSKYLLFLYVDLGSGPERIGLFDPVLQNYFWRYDNNGLKLAQLRFYMNPTCVPPAGEVPIVSSIDLEPDCVAPGGETVITINGTNTNWSGVKKGEIEFRDMYGPTTDVGIKNGAPYTATASQLIFTVEVDGEYVVPSDPSIAIYWQDGTSEWQTAMFDVSTSCPS